MDRSVLQRIEGAVDTLAAVAVGFAGAAAGAAVVALTAAGLWSQGADWRTRVASTTDLWVHLAIGPWAFLAGLLAAYWSARVCGCASGRTDAVLRAGVAALAYMVASIGVARASAFGRPLLMVVDALMAALSVIAALAFRSARAGSR